MPSFCCYSLLSSTTLTNNILPFLYSHFCIQLFFYWVIHFLLIAFLIITCIIDFWYFDVFSLRFVRIIWVICLFSFLIGLWLLGVFSKVKSIEGAFTLMGVTIDTRGKPFGKIGKFDLFHLSIIYLLYKSFYRRLFYSYFFFNEFINIIL